MKVEIMALYFTVSVFILITLSNTETAHDDSKKKYFDLSYSFDKNTIYFPGQLQYELHMDYSNVTKPGFT